MAPDERALHEHLRGGRFLSGVADGRWRLVEVEWPLVTVTVSAAERENSPTEFALRLDLTEYPNTAPTGGIWDLAAGTTLAAGQRPKGDRVALVFRFEGGGCGPTGMYAPWDRLGLQSHSNWAHEVPLLAWNSTRDLSFLLACVHELLNADDYLGV